MMISEAVRRAEEGLDLGCARLIARNVRTHRKNGIIGMELFLQGDSDDEFLLSVALYAGREPHYRPWIEMFCINNLLETGEHYFDSSIEDEVLGFFCGALGPGGKIYIEYYCDQETIIGLTMGYPPAATRQGYKLFNLGFTWFKDYYYSEGGHEGGQKLLGEKPLDEVALGNHLKRIRSEIEIFLNGSKDFGIESQRQEYLLKARERAKKILNQVMDEHSTD